MLSSQGPRIAIVGAGIFGITTAIKLAEAGYEVTVEPKRLNLGGLDVTIAFFNGPCGESIEFFQVHG